MQHQKYTAVLTVEALLQPESPIKGALSLLLTSKSSENLFNSEEKLHCIQMMEVGISFVEVLKSRTRDIFAYLCDQTRLKFYLKIKWVK
jgi:hypothetical protein